MFYVVHLKWVHNTSVYLQGDENSGIGLFELLTFDLKGPTEHSHSVTVTIPSLRPSEGGGWT